MESKKEALLAARLKESVKAARSATTGVSLTAAHMEALLAPDINSVLEQWANKSDDTVYHTLLEDAEGVEGAEGGPRATGATFVRVPDAVLAFARDQSLWAAALTPVIVEGVDLTAAPKKLADKMARVTTRVLKAAMLTTTANGAKFALTGVNRALDDGRFDEALLDAGSFQGMQPALLATRLSMAELRLSVDDVILNAMGETHAWAAVSYVACGWCVGVVVVAWFWRKCRWCCTWVCVVGTL